MYTYIFVLICIPTTTFLLKKIRLIIFIYSFRVSFNKIKFENKQIYHNDQYQRKYLENRQ